MATERVLIEMEKQQNAETEQALMETLRKIETNREKSMRRLEQERSELRERYEVRIRRGNSEQQREIQIKEAEVLRITTELKDRVRLNQEQLDAHGNRTNQNADQIRILLQQKRNLEEGLRHVQNRGGGSGGCAVM
ncbi:uncharacterized protein LOC106166875 [Lingula anatina]|uniref:Uncharacterized protein LOC106166875 n=1 Tax=Lingula anatina TaxID=7574 RepID=A0A1S3ITY2_LINAN|nr:uncharacterized protein LOC106166875 [Lingula anatina]XP_013400995.1 uncharacterized protein LOC106166875 [Lingula anatina]|eukprot:XP_013400994.1 uncharacterized protein LOC106166875 [Lingula anatina]